KLATAQVWRKHAADWPLIRGVICMPANVPVHRANIQARSTADAVQHFALFSIAQQAAASVVQKNNVKLFRAISFTRFARPGNQSAVSGNRLAGAGGRKGRPERSKINQPRNYFLNSRNRHMNSRQAGTQPSIAFIG